MQYEGAIFRPPSEAYSLLMQVTIGCSWNKCEFCNMYAEKHFRVRSIEDVRRDFEECAPYRDRFEHIFLCDGDAFALSAAKLIEIMDIVNELFPGIKGVRSYASARNVLTKTQGELNTLRAMGIDKLYIGLESGNDDILREYNKGINRQEMIDAAKMLHEAGIRQSVSIIAGMGEENHWREHMLDTATALNQMQPEFIGLLTLTPGGELRPPTPEELARIKRPDSVQVLKEMQLLLQNLEMEDCIFSTGHISNQVQIRGTLPTDKGRMLELVDHLLDSVG
ncbi:MAG: radical SAM protein [Ruminococcaceae bacterium]|nr:radical SAM protein [Oscillospiraceae bacterium]